MRLRISRGWKWELAVPSRDVRMGSMPPMKLVPHDTLQYCLHGDFDDWHDVDVVEQAKPPHPADADREERTRALSASLAKIVNGCTEQGLKQGTSLTIDPNDPRLTHGVDNKPVPQAEVYLVLSEEERAKGFVRPYRDAYRHVGCGNTTTMGRALSETYARDPKFYSATYCCACSKHLPVAEFRWVDDGEVVGS